MSGSTATAMYAYLPSPANSDATPPMAVAVAVVYSTFATILKRSWLPSFVMSHLRNVEGAKS